MKTSNIVLGIMSGTSLDGVDYALCRIGKGGISLLGLWSVNYPGTLMKRIMRAAHDESSSYEVAQLHHDLGRFYADKAPKVKCDYIGLHGQTIYHRPHSSHGATFQIGEPTYLARRFGVPVIHQFRNMDLALGGQGAPLATLFHREVFSHEKFNVAVNNLGGISNVTYLPALKSKNILSFDTGPANLLIDAAIKHFTKGKLSFDRDGIFASRGLASEGLVQKWLKNSFLKQRPPKSTGREAFGGRFFEGALRDCRTNKLNSYDAVATFTEFTARSIAEAYGKFLPKFPDLVILAGGGAMNPNLVDRIRLNLRKKQWEKQGKNLSKPIGVTTSDALGWPAQSIEPAAFAFLAYRTKKNLPGNIPATTGAKKAAVLGQVVPAP